MPTRSRAGCCRCFASWLPPACRRRSTPTASASPPPRSRPARSVVNDVSGGLGDPGDGRRRARRRLPVDPHALARRTAATMQSSRTTTTSSRTSAPSCARASTPRWPPASTEAALVIDPGLGFAKTGAAQLGAAAALAAARRARPAGAGRRRRASRSSARCSPIPTASPRPVDEREDATTALTAYCALQGVWGVRVHDVRPSVDAAPRDRSGATWLTDITLHRADACAATTACSTSSAATARTSSSTSSSRSTPRPPRAATTSPTPSTTASSRTRSPAWSAASR